MFSQYLKIVLGVMGYNYMKLIQNKNIYLQLDMGWDEELKLN
jgi:hypothetical protein